MKTSDYKRRPIKHFIMMSRVQWQYIRRVMLMVAITTVLTILCVALVYALKYKSGYFYYLSQNMEGDLIRRNIWELLLPSFVFSAFGTILLGLGISLYSSRKIALPLFKIRRWAENVFAGNFKHRVTLRDNDNLDELMTSCNQVSRSYSALLQKLQDTSTDDSLTSEEKIAGIQKTLSEVEF